MSVSPQVRTASNGSSIALQTNFNRVSEALWAKSFPSIIEPPAANCWTDGISLRFVVKNL